MRARVKQKGSALIAALFLVVVVAALGAFAIRIQNDQQQVATLQLLQYRAVAAARTGLEYAAGRIAAAGGSGACARVQPLLDLANEPGLSGFQVGVQCIEVGGEGVYEITATAQAGVFGSPDFVRREASRRIAPSLGVFD